jgi:prepilin-type N-terminal cleavage/methylation domain-containing protein
MSQFPNRAVCRRGVTILELLIALAISAMLLVATAVAVDASLRAYQANQEQSSLMQRARIAIDRITTVIRTTKAHQPDSSSAASSFAVGATVTDIGIDLFDTNNVETIFRYDAPTQRILAIVGGKTYVLASGVTAFSIKMEPMRSAESIRTGGGWDLLQRATISLTVKTTGNTATSSETTNTQAITLSASVMPRPNTW